MLSFTPVIPVLQVKRRLAQNREAARKSRARKKEYLKRLELEVRGSVLAGRSHRP